MTADRYPGYSAVLGDGHQAVEDDTASCNLCRYCGEEVWWPGPGPYDWAHSAEDPQPAESVA